MMVHKPLSVVMVPRLIQQSRQEMHQKVDLEKACLAEAGRQFTQACDTPMLTPPLIDIFGLCGNPNFQVLNGNFLPPPHCNPLVAKFLSASSHPLLAVNVPARPLSVYCKGWQKSWEMTGSLA